MSWTLLRLRSSGTRHILGYRVETGRGRTSSPIRAFDRQSATAATASGNRYVLTGEASDDGVDDVLVLWWLALHNLSLRDIEIIGTNDLLLH